MDKKQVIESLVARAHELGCFTGAWLYAENGKIVSKGAIGYADIHDKTPINEESVFDLASITKQFTASSIMLLRRKGVLDLDDDITKFFPELPFPGIKIRHLLSHTGGLPDYDDEDIPWMKNEFIKLGRVPGNDAVIRFLAESGQKAKFAPGEEWSYSNTGYCVLAQIVEKVSGIPFEEFLQRNIFEPAGMKSTRVYHRRKDGISIDNLATGLVINPKTGEYILPDDVLEYQYAVFLDGVNGDGLVHSNILDLFAWDQALREEKILTKEEQALMYTPVKLNNGETYHDDEEGEEYGFGWSIINEARHGLVVAHGGGWPGYSHWFERYIDANCVLILLTCRQDQDARVGNTLLDDMRAVASGKEIKPLQTIAELAVKNPDKSAYSSYCGKYDHLFIKEIYQKDGELYMSTILSTLTNIAYEYKLYPLGDNEFGIKTYTSILTFGDGTITMFGETGKKC